MIKAEINKDEITMEAKGKGIELIAEAGVFLEALINDMSRGAPDEKGCKDLVCDLIVDILRRRIHS